MKLCNMLCLRASCNQWGWLICIKLQVKKQSKGENMRKFYHLKDEVSTGLNLPCHVRLSSMAESGGQAACTSMLWVNNPARLELLCRVTACQLHAC